MSLQSWQITKSFTTSVTCERISPMNFFMNKIHCSWKEGFFTNVTFMRNVFFVVKFFFMSFRVTYSCITDFALSVFLFVCVLCSDMSIEIWWACERFITFLSARSMRALIHLAFLLFILLLLCFCKFSHFKALRA